MALTKDERDRLLERIAKLLALGKSERGIAAKLDLSRSKVRRAIAAIRAEARRQITSLDVLSYAAELVSDTKFRQRLLLGMFIHAKISKDHEGATALNREIRSNDAFLTKALQSMGLVYLLPQRILADVRYHEIIDSLPDGLVQRMAALPAPEAQKLLRAELGEARYAALGLSSDEIASDPAPAGGGPSLRLA